MSDPKKFFEQRQTCLVSDLRVSASNRTGVQVLVDPRLEPCLLVDIQPSGDLQLTAERAP